MAIVIQHRCHACGAPCQGGREVWVRCPFCGALLAYDLSAWFESEEYARFLRLGAAAITRWDEHGRLMAAARRAGLAGDRAGYRRLMREACALQLELTPHVVPPEAQQPGAYREAQLDWLVWWQERQDLDPELAALTAEMQRALAAVDYRDPLPTLERAAELLGRQQRLALERGDAPPDPDGMPPDARERLSLASMASGYYPVLDRPGRLALLRAVYGADNVREVGPPIDEMGLFVPWTCPRCGLVSLQARSALELTCTACFHQRPRGEDDELPAIETRCAECGADVSMPAGARETRCPFCHGVVWRMVRSFDVERRFALDIVQQHGGAPRGQEGLPLDAGNHRSLVLEGLVRQACWYWRFLSPARLLQMVETSLPGDDTARALREVIALARSGGQDPEGLRLLEDALRLLEV